MQIFQRPLGLLATTEAYTGFQLTCYTADFVAAGGTALKEQTIKAHKKQRQQVGWSGTNLATIATIFRQSCPKWPTNDNSFGSSFLYSTPCY